MLPQSFCRWWLTLGACTRVTVVVPLVCQVSVTMLTATYYEQYLIKYIITQILQVLHCFYSSEDIQAGVDVVNMDMVWQIL